MASSTINSTNQVIGAFGTNTDALSLVRNMIEGAVNMDTVKLGQAATDAIKLGIYYADLLGKKTGDTGLVNGAASLALKLDNLNTKLSTGKATTYADWAEVIAEAGNVGGDLALKYGKNPAALEAGLYLKGGSVLVSYSAVVLGDLPITAQVQIVSGGRNTLQQIDAAMGGSASITINQNASSLSLAQTANDGTTTALSFTSTNNAIVTQRLN